MSKSSQTARTSDAISSLNNTQGLHRAGGHAHAAAVAPFRIDLRPALVDRLDGVVITAPAAGHTDHIIPGDAGFPVQLRRADGWPGGSVVDRFIQGTGFDTGLAEGAARCVEIQVWQAGQVMVLRMQVDNARIAGGHAGVCAAGTMRLERQAPVPGWWRPQRLLS